MAEWRYLAAVGVLFTSLAAARGAQFGDARKAGAIARVEELRDGDRVVFLGNDFFEREHEFGYVEAALTSLWPERRVTFRNLGRSGDTVWGDAWAAFDTAKEGFARRRDLVAALKPTLVLVAYGMVESFEGEAGLARFEEGLNELLNALAPTGARIVLVGPTIHEVLPAPLPSPEVHNRSLDKYRGAMAKVAEARGLGWVDLAYFRVGDGTRPDGGAGSRQTGDGIHLNALGYRQAGRALGDAVGPDGVSAWSLELKRGPDGLDVGRSAGAAVTEAEAGGAGGALRFVVRDERVTDPGASTEDGLSQRRLRVEGLEPGEWVLKIDGGGGVVQASAAAWADGIALGECPERAQAEALRQAIVEKNRLLYYRWRPENETYLFGFRKHEQGQNAAEIPEFDALVAAKEADIERLRTPTKHAYELVRVEDER